MKQNPRIEALKGWIQEQHFDGKNVKRYAREFQHNKPFSHLVLKNFLQPKQLVFLRTALEKQEFEIKDTDLFYLQQTKELRNSNSIVFSSFYTMLSSSYFQKWLQEITDIQKLKNTIDFIGTNFPRCGYLLPHDDFYEHRKIAYTFYLSQTLCAKEGGVLELFAVNSENSPTKVVRSYPIQENSLIFLKVTRQSYHQVTEMLTDKKRLTLGGWFHG